MGLDEDDAAAAALELTAVGGRKVVLMEMGRPDIRLDQRPLPHSHTVREVAGSVCICLRDSIQLDVFCIHLMFLADEIIHKQMQISIML